MTKTLMKYPLLILAFLSLSGPFAQSLKYHPGQKVEIYNIKWYPGSIVSLGTGSNGGYYYVHYDGFSDASNHYMAEKNIRLPKMLQADNYAGGPRNGRYIILSYGSITNPIRGGFLDLSNGKYNYLDAAKRSLGTGSYKYDAGSKKVLWLNGPLKAFGESAPFEIDREGKTHKIRLMNATIASNSTDS